MVGKTVIVTGANTGIGYYSALDFAKRGANVILACRNERKANEAKDSIIKKSGNPNISIKLVDFRSLKSIREFCADVNKTVEKIDVLLNNAGAAGLKPGLTEDGLDGVWQTNYFSPYLLTVLLVEKLKKSGPCRVVNVASIMGKLSNVSLETVNTCNESMVYSWTKQCNILFTRELAKRLKDTKVHVYALHPGAIYTDIWRHLPKWFLLVWIPMMKFIYKTAEEGAQTSIYCSVAKECENDSGKLYAECKEIEMYDSCKDMTFAEALWEKSADLVKLQEHERI